MVHEETRSPVSLELSDELIRRIDALAFQLKKTELGRHLHLTRELVLRLALLHGLEELEQMNANVSSA